MPFTPPAIGIGALDVSTGDWTCTANAESVGSTAASDRGGMNAAATRDACTPSWSHVSIDAAQLAASARRTEVLMFDSGAGSVTGGCWFDSPNGANPAAPALTCTSGDSVTQ